MHRCWLDFEQPGRHLVYLLLTGNRMYAVIPVPASRSGWCVGLLHHGRPTVSTCIGADIRTRPSYQCERGFLSYSNCLFLLLNTNQTNSQRVFSSPRIHLRTTFVGRTFGSDATEVGDSMHPSCLRCKVPCHAICASVGTRWNHSLIGSRIAACLM